MGENFDGNGGRPIELNGLRKSFGRQTVLDGIDLAVARGETLAVLGRSGTGKSVLLKLIIGLQQADAGAIRVGGEDVTHSSTQRLNEIRKNIGFLFQQGALYDSLTVEENVAFPLSRHSKMERSELKERVHQLLSTVAMEKDVAKMPSEISGGMQRGWVWRAPSRWTPKSCSSTSRRRHSIRSRPPRSAT